MNLELEGNVALVTAASKGLGKAVALAPAREGTEHGRVGTVDEFGRTVAWLASPAASYIHGHALMFDGGAVPTPL